MLIEQSEHNGNSLKTHRWRSRLEHWDFTTQTCLRLDKKQLVVLIFCQQLGYPAESILLIQSKSELVAALPRLSACSSSRAACTFFSSARPSTGWAEPSWAGQTRVSSSRMGIHRDMMSEGDREAAALYRGGWPPFVLSQCWLIALINHWWLSREVSLLHRTVFISPLWNTSTLTEVLPL